MKESGADLRLDFVLLEQDSGQRLLEQVGALGHDADLCLLRVDVGVLVEDLLPELVDLVAHIAALARLLITCRARAG